MMYDSKTINYTGSDFEKIQNTDVSRILQACLLVTVGDKLKHLLIDNNGNVRQQSKLEEGASTDRFEPLNRDYKDKKTEGLMEGCFLEPQMLYKSSNNGQKVSSVAFVAEAGKSPILSRLSAMMEASSCSLNSHRHARLFLLPPLL